MLVENLFAYPSNNVGEILCVKIYVSPYPGDDCHPVATMPLIRRHLQKAALESIFKTRTDAHVVQEPHK